MHTKQSGASGGLVGSTELLQRAGDEQAERSRRTTGWCVRTVEAHREHRSA
jgi:hypothetical protein